MSIYQDKILDHYRNPRNFGRIKNADKTAEVFNHVCGDRIDMDIVIKEGGVEEIRFEAKGCAISRASASLLTEYAKHKKIDELKKLDKAFIINLLEIDLGPNRIKCALLPLEALKKLIINGQ